MAKVKNSKIADVLERIADLLETQDENTFKVRAYREGAQTIRDMNKSAAEMVVKDKFDDLKKLPNIGDGIAAVIGEYVASGKSNLLEDLESSSSPEAVFMRVPGIGQELAERIAHQLDIHRLPELEEAAHDGRLATVEGFGERRVKAIKTALSGMLSQSARIRQQERTEDDSSDKTARPSVELLLKVDEEYRRAEKGDLRKIAPRRFNPKKEAWLPVLHTTKDDWKFTALYSNTEQAHRLEKTDDWVVIYYERDGKQRQNTVVTETQGALKGKRVVRGRALETMRHYGAKKGKSDK